MSDRDDLMRKNKLVRDAKQALLDRNEDASITDLMWKTEQELEDIINASSKPKPKPGSPKPKAKPVGDGSGLEQIAELLDPYLQPSLDEERVREIVIETVNSGMVTKQLDVNVITPGQTITIKGAHRQLPEVLFWIGKGRHVYLYGKPGTGKTTLAKQAAKGLGRKWGYMMLNNMSTPSQILGFVGADAKTYKPSVMRDLYDQSAIFCLDELDNANPNTLTTINGPIENGECQFPDGILAMHDEFKIIATGNTAGRGGSVMHAGRQALDAATLARFVCIELEIDLDLEERMVAAAAPTNAHNVLEFIREVRAYCEKNDVKLVVSPREAVAVGIGMETAPFDDMAVLNHALFKGFNPDSVRTILKNVRMPAFTRVTPTPAQKATAKVKP